MRKSFLLLFFKKEESFFFDDFSAFSCKVARASSARKKEIQPRRHEGTKDFTQESLRVFSWSLGALVVIFVCLGAWS
jgi:hypothetical protein